MLKKKRKKKKWIILILICGILAAAFLSLGKSSKYVDAEEWVISQKKNLEDFTLITNGTDNALTMYSMDSISLDDLKNEIYMGYYEILVLKAAYEQNLKEHPIKPGSHTVETKKAQDAMDKIYQDLESMYLEMDSIVSGDFDINALIYMYMGYGQSIKENLNTYMETYYLLCPDEYIHNLQNQDTEPDTSNNRETNMVYETEEVTNG